jgi:hypothetical protein
MAHFAELNENNEVLQVIVIANDALLDEQGVEQESLGIVFCENLFGGTWKQTSYNGNFRKHFAGVGFTYDSGRNAFIPPKPFASWILDEETCTWEAPAAMPVSSGETLVIYAWNEETTSWDQVDSRV